MMGLKTPRRKNVSMGVITNFSFGTHLYNIEPSNFSKHITSETNRAVKYGGGGVDGPEDD